MATAASGAGQMGDLIKMQLFMGDGKDGQMVNKLKSFIFLTLFDVILSFGKTIFTQVGKYVQKWYDEKIKKRFESKMGNVLTTKEPLENEIVFERVYDGKASKNSGDMNERTDSVLFYITKLPEARKMIYTDGIHVVNNGVEFKINKNIYFKLMKLEFGTEHQLSHIKFKLYSKTIDVCDLRKYVDKLLREYLIDKQNRLGTDLYFFDHSPPPETNGMSMMAQDKTRNRNLPTFFTKNLFITNRTLNNVFFEQRQEVLDRVNFFMNRKDWYDEKGIPYTLGFMLHGAPGTGKTSCVKAIANMTKRHVVNINLGQIKTKDQLKKLFYDNRLEVMERSDIGSQRQSYIIPIDQRLYVIEDIDCLSGDILKKRDDEDKKEKNGDKPIKATSNIDFQKDMIQPYASTSGGMSSAFASLTGNDSNTSGFASSTSISDLKGTQCKKEKDKKDDEDDTELDLSSILNVMDGTLETPGRMIIITSNYPERLDHAFIRPGRIDMIIEFKKANRKIIGEMYNSFYDKPARHELLQCIGDYKWTPAEVSQILFKHFHNPVQSLIDLYERDPKEYFKFSYFDNDNITKDKPDEYIEDASETSNSHEDSETSTDIDNFSMVIEYIDTETSE